MTNELLRWLVTGGAATLLLGVLTAWLGRGKNRADAAKINSETSVLLLSEMRKDRDEREHEMQQIRTALLALIDAVEAHADALRDGGDPQELAARLRRDLRTAREAV